MVGSAEPLAVHGAYGVVADRAEFADAHTVVRARATSPRSSSPLPSNLPKSPFWFTPSRSLTVSSSLLPPARPQVTSVGNALRFQDTSSSTSRFLWGVGRAISCFAVSVEGGLVAYAESGSRDPTIRVHALDTLAPVASLEGCASSAVTALAFSRDGRFLAAASALPDLALTLRDARAGDPVVRTRLSSEAASIAFNPFDAHELLVTHVPAGVLSPHPGVTLHVVRHSHGEPPAVRARELRVDAVGVAPAAIVAAAWSPERTVYLGTDAGALLVVHPDTGDVVPPPPRVAESVAADLRARGIGVRGGARAPDGASLAWAVVPDGAPARGFAFTKTRVAIAGGRDGAVRFHAHARTRRRAVETEIPARLVKTLGVSGGEGDETTSVAFSPTFESAVVVTRRRGVYLVTGLLDEDGPISERVRAGMETIGEAEEEAEEGVEGVEGFSDGSGSRRRATRVGEYHEGAATGAAALVDGGVATCGVDGTIRGWNVHHPTSTPSWIRRVASTHAAMAASADPRGSAVVAVASTLGVLRVFDARGGASRGAVPGLSLRARLSATAPDALAMNRAGTRVAFVAAEGRCWFVDVAGEPTSADEREAAAAKIANLATTARVVGELALPFPRAVAAAWIANDRLLVSGPDGELASVRAPPAGAETAAEARVVATKTDVALVAMAVSPSDGDATTTRIVAVGADRTLRAYDIPDASDAGTWRPEASLGASSTAPERLWKIVAGAGLVTNASGDASATAGADGRVVAWGGERGVGGGETHARAVHDAVVGGANALVVTRDGKLASAGADGAVFVVVAPGFAPVAVSTTTPTTMKTATMSVDVVPDVPDDAEEPTVASSGAVAGEAEVDAATLTGEISAAAAAAREAAAAKITNLARRLEDTIARNDAADEMTRVPREELLVDETFRAKLVEEGERRVEEARTRALGEIVRAEYASSKIKEACWDTMETRGAAVVALAVPGLAVHRYPLPLEDKAARLGRRVAFLRRVEMAERAHLREAERGVPGAEAFDFRVDAPKKEDPAAKKGGPAAAAAAAAAASAESADAAEAPDPDSFEATLYDPSALYPPRRKMTQLALLEMTTREVKRAFNVEFAEMEAEKQKFLDKIGGINSRIADIRLELKGHTDDAGPLFEPIVSPLERENYVLSVEDDEISAEKWLSAEERATLEAAEEAERERIRAKGANPPEDRALKDMMGGRLEKAEEGGVPDELPKPDWMVEIPREEWNDEQRKQGREFENKAKVYREELAKRRAALAIELARSHEESAETVAKFDELLWEFLLRRNAVDARLAQMEADIITCAHEAETALDDDEVEEARIADALAAARGRKAETAAAAAAHRTRVDAFQRRVNACDSQNQKLEREFRRDFAEADDLFDPLLALYKRRKAPNRTEADGTPAPETARRRAGREAGRRLKAAGTRLGEAAAGSPASPPLSPSADTFADAALSVVAGRETLERTSSPTPEVSFSRAPPGSDVAAERLVRGSRHDPFHGALGGVAADQARRPRPPPVEPLDERYDRPEDCDDRWWTELVAHRDRKIAKEEELRDLKAELDASQRRAFELAEEDAVALAEAEALESAAEAHSARRVDSLYDLALPIKMKRAFVEAELPEFTPEGGLEAQAAAEADAMLVHRGVVEYLNEVIQGHGAGKVETLVAIKDFKKGIYDLQWETAKLSMESEDLVTKIKELQMTRPPQNLLRDILVDGDPSRETGDQATKPGDAPPQDAVTHRRKNEMANLEAQLDHAKKLHARRVAEKEKELAKIQKKTAQIASQNQQIMSQVADLDVAVKDVEKLQESRGAVAGDNATAAKARKMRALVTQSKLQHIAKAQSEEMEMLRAELERARLRTFPSFVERERTDRVHLPDIGRPNSRRRR